MKDKIVEKVLESYRKRSEIGIKKYNTTLERNDLGLFEWLNHLQEELMDATLYIEKLKDEVGDGNDIPYELCDMCTCEKCMEITMSERKNT